MAEPAIADLQFEAGAGRIARARASFAVCRAIGVALAGDLATDSVDAVAALGSPRAVVQGASMLGVVTAGYVLWFLFIAYEFAAPAWLLALWLVPCAIPLALLPALLLAAREATRRTVPVRGLVLTALAIAALMFVYVDQAITRTNREFRRIDAAARGLSFVSRDGAREMTSRQILRPDLEIAEAEGRGHRSEFALEPHHRAAVALSCVAYALFGVALARIRLLAALPIVAAIYVGHFILLQPALWLSNHVPFLVGIFAWLPTIVLIVASAAVCRSSVRRFVSS